MVDDKAATSERSDSSPAMASSPSTSAKPLARDCFSDLPSLMRTKKPYASNSKPTAQDPPLAALTDSHCLNATMPLKSILPSLAKSVDAPETVSEFFEKQGVSNPFIFSAESATKSRPEETAQSPDTPEAKITSVVELPRNKAPVNSPQTAPTDGFEQKVATKLEKLASPKTDKDLDTMKAHLWMLERDILVLKKENDKLREAKEKAESKSGMLNYQNGIHKDQASSMCRSLAEKDTLIQTGQLEIEELTRKLSDAKAKLKEYGDAKLELDRLRDTVEGLTRERDEAVRTCANHEGKIKTLADTLSAQQELTMSLRHELVEESLKVTQLEDAMREGDHSHEAEIIELRVKLRDKTVQLKTAEAQLKDSQDRLLHMSKNGLSLQGAVHLVKPSAHTQLPKNVFACSECYANNLNCDDAATCRSCTERNDLCVRWRCSLKHKLGTCPLTPCKFPHDAQGWLVRKRERPEW